MVLGVQAFKYVGMDSTPSVGIAMMEIYWHSYSLGRYLCLFGHIVNNKATKTLCYRVVLQGHRVPKGLKCLI